MNARRRVVLQGLSALALPVVAIAHPQVAATSDVYTLTDLGDEIGYVTAINDAGQITSIVVRNQRVLPDYHALVWQNGMIRELETLGGVSSYATAINNRGEIVGWSTTERNERHACLWANGRIHDLGTLGGANSWASDINDHSQIVGGSDYPGGKPGETHAWLWDGNGLRDLRLNTSEIWGRAAGINNRGQIIVNSDTSYNNAPWLWQNGTFQMLPTIGQYYNTDAGSINETGQIVGRASQNPGNGMMTFIVHLLLWQDGQVHDLGPIGQDDPVYIAMNNAGLITVGSSSFKKPPVLIFPDGSVHDLNSMIYSSPITLSTVYAINNVGQMVARGAGQYAQHTYLLSPTRSGLLPETGNGAWVPGSILSGLALLAAGTVLRRRAMRRR